MANTINVNTLTPDATYLVRGKVAFSRITRQTTDAERAAANQSRQHPIDKNYTTMTIYDAQILCKDPANPSLEERYASEKLYKSSSPEQPGYNFSAMNKSRNLPKVGVVAEGSTSQYNEIIPTGELAHGVDVTLVMRVFKGQGNNGVSLDRVLVNEPIRYFVGTGSAVEKSLSEMGITFNALSPDEAASAAATANTAPAADAAPAAQAAPAAPAATDNPFSFNPGSAPATTAAANTDEAPKFGPGVRQY